MSSSAAEGGSDARQLALALIASQSAPSQRIASAVERARAQQMPLTSISTGTVVGGSRGLGGGLGGVNVIVGAGGRMGGSGAAGGNEAARAAASLAAKASPASSSFSSLKRKTMNSTAQLRGINLEYCEFNLSTMHDTRGGFIVDDSATDDLATVQQQHQSNHQQDQQGANDFTRAPVSTLPPDALCREQTCKSIDIHPDYHKHYAVLVCRKCAQDPDKASAYALLTKTECREDYLLTESELRDTARLPHWMKKNPHKDTYANMLLYLRAQVEAFAIEKWGSLEKLDEEFARREETKGQRKKKKFETKLVELRKKTLTSTWRRVEKVHVHEFGDKVGKGGGMFEQTCETCGLVDFFEEM